MPTNDIYTGSRILITGASSGIGWEMARQLAARAQALVLVARREERLRKLADELRAANPRLEVQVVAADLANVADVDRMLSEAARVTGDVDVLINNAGLGDIGLFDLSSWDKIHTMLELNVVALTYLTRRLIEPMISRGRGAILNVSSGFGLTFMPGFAAYVGTKHFVSSFTESLRLEVRHKGIIVSHLCPGPVATEFEEMAGNPTGRSVPGWVEISAERCARAALRGLARGKALIVPGLAAKLLIGLGRLTPRFLLRLTYLPVGSYFRRKQLEAPRSLTSSDR